MESRGLDRNTAALLKLTEWVKRHTPDDPVVEKDLNDQGYETYRDVQVGIERLTGAVEIYQKRLLEVTERMNTLATMKTSDQNRLDDISDSESSDSELLKR